MTGIWDQKADWSGETERQAAKVGRTISYSEKGAKGRGRVLQNMA